MSIENGVNAAGALISDVSGVHNMRAAIYEKKLEIIKTPMVQEILHSIVPNPAFPPAEIIINRNCAIVRPRDEASQTYHPNGIVVYTPEVTFDYYFGTALCLIIQDLYPQIYSMPTVTMSQLSEMLEQGTWYANLQMLPQYKNTSLSPAFPIEDLTAKSLEALPVELKDPKAKKISKIPTFALILSILSVLFGFFPAFGTLPGIAGIILSIIGMSTNTQKKKCVWSLILSILGALIIPIIVAIIGFNSMFGDYL